MLSMYYYGLNALPTLYYQLYFMINVCSCMLLHHHYG